MIRHILRFYLGPAVVAGCIFWLVFRLLFCQQ